MEIFRTHWAISNASDFEAMQSEIANYYPRSDSLPDLIKSYAETISQNLWINLYVNLVSRNRYLSLHILVFFFFFIPDRNTFLIVTHLIVSQQIKYHDNFVFLSYLFGPLQPTARVRQLLTPSVIYSFN